MIIIFKGKGILLLVYVIVSFFAVAFISGVLNRNVGGIFAYNYHFLIIVGLAVLVAGIWTHLTAVDYTRNEKGEKIFVDDDFYFFFIKMKYWAYILYALGVIGILIGVNKTVTS